MQLSDAKWGSPLAEQGHLKDSGSHEENSVDCGPLCI